MSRRLRDAVRLFLNRNLISTLSGMTTGDWLRLLFENRFRVEPRYWPRAFFVTATSLFNSSMRPIEQWVYGARLRAVAMEPPLFILGHWRSGTTHLLHLLTQDARFASPNLYQVLFPHTFLCTEKAQVKIWAFLAPPTRLIDNMRFGFQVPYDCEFALCSATGLSPYVGFSFPRHWERYREYLTLRGAPSAEVERWKAAFSEFARKLTVRYGRPLLFKAPPLTCRIRLLLEMFPRARFIHIHRHPYEVFISTCHMNTVALPTQLQRQDPAALEPQILERYRIMYDAFFEERVDVSPGRLIDVRYDDLTRDPLGEISRIYRDLKLPSFEEARPSLQKYLESLGGYRKNVYPDLPDVVRRRIASAWARSFAEWGYEA